MISILIPTYNYNATDLVHELNRQCLKEAIPYEILVYDDGSKSEENKINTEINTLDNCRFKALENNIGRSAIRNLLASHARYKSLLFIDSGTVPLNTNFIKNYVEHIQYQVVTGGMVATKAPPKKPYKLRWLFTKHREAKTLCSSNFLIQKQTFLQSPFNASITKYGYEDVLFYSKLKEKGIPVKIIDNPVVHAHDDDANTFIAKTETALENLKFLTANGMLSKKTSKISRYYHVAEKLKMINFMAFIFKILKSGLMWHLNSNKPLLVCYDIYRLGYFCTLKKIE